MVLFSWWKQVGNNCSLYIHFTSRTPNYIYSTILKVTFIINYNRALRRLEEKKGICSLVENGINSYAKYLCKFLSDNSNIKSVKILPNIVFDSPDNITLYMTPIVKRFLNNIQELKDQFNYFSNSQIYILDHCIKIKYQKNNGIREGCRYYGCSSKRSLYVQVEHEAGAFCEGGVNIQVTMHLQGHLLTDRKP